MQTDIIENLHKRAKLSWVTIFFVLAILLFLAPMGIVFSWKFVGLFLISAAGLNLLFSWFLKKRIFLDITSWLWPVVEVWIITLIVYYTGGFASVFSFLYLIPIIISALLFSRNAGLGIAIFSSATYLTLTILEVYALIPHVSEIGLQVLAWQNNIYIALSVLLNRILIFFAVAYLGGFLSSKQKEVERMKTEFVSMASHQLRTPVTSIRLFVEMLRKEAPKELSDKHKEYLDNIYHCSKRMVHLFNDFLSVSRIEDGRLKPEPQLIDLKDLIQSIIDQLKPLAKEKNCHVIFQKPEKLACKVLLDPDLIRQVIRNVITNAIRYSDSQESHTWIDLTQTRNDYVVQVKDEGIGIAKDSKRKIFEKFFRTESACKLETEGSGLGLYIAKMLIEYIKGRIWFESELGKGTTFYISIPKKGMKKIKPKNKYV